MNIRLVSSGSQRFRLWGFQQRVPWLTVVAYQDFLHRSIEDHSLLMGRKTFELLYSLEVLPPTASIIVLSSQQIEKENVTICPSLECALEKAHERGKDLAVLGGLQVFKELMESADKIFFMRLSEELRDGECFPEISKDIFRRVSIEHGRIKSNETKTEFGREKVGQKIWSYDIQQFYRRPLHTCALPP
jgi:dihydrofolate reductase